eukprot:6243860-Amphidinium_carterae.1
MRHERVLPQFAGLLVTSRRVIAHDGETVRKRYKRLDAVLRGLLKYLVANGRQLERALGQIIFVFLVRRNLLLIFGRCCSFTRAGRRATCPPPIPTSLGMVLAGVAHGAGIATTSDLGFARSCWSEVFSGKYHHDEAIHQLEARIINLVLRSIAREKGTFHLEVLLLSDIVKAVLCVRILQSRCVLQLLRLLGQCRRETTKSFCLASKILLRVPWHTSEVDSEKSEHNWAEWQCFAQTFYSV